MAYHVYICCFFLVILDKYNVCLGIYHRYMYTHVKHENNLHNKGNQEQQSYWFFCVFTWNKSKLVCSTIFLCIVLSMILCIVYIKRDMNMFGSCFWYNSISIHTYICIWWYLLLKRNANPGKQQFYTNTTHKICYSSVDFMVEHGRWNAKMFSVLCLCTHWCCFYSFKSNLLRSRMCQRC